MFLVLLGCVLIFACGIFMFFKPDTVWYLTESWKSYGADGPSDFYLKTARFSGALLALFALVMAVLYLVLE